MSSTTAASLTIIDFEAPIPQTSTGVFNPVVSGAIGVAPSPTTQNVILMVNIANIPYFLTADAGGNPFYMQLYAQPETGLSVFTTNALRLIPSYSPGGSQRQLTLQNAATSAYYGYSLESGTIIAPSSAVQRALPIADAGYDDSSLFACNVSYPLGGVVTFLYAIDYYTTPGSITIANVANGAVQTLIPIAVSSLVNANGDATNDNVLVSIYNNITGLTPPSYYFTSTAEYKAGGMLPFAYCLTGVCGPQCLGMCDDGLYSRCLRNKTGQQFMCAPQPTIACRAGLAALFLVPLIAAMATVTLFVLVRVYGVHSTKELGKIGIKEYKKDHFTTLEVAIIALILLAISGVLIYLLIEMLLGGKVAVTLASWVCAIS